MLTADQIRRELGMGSPVYFKKMEAKKIMEDARSAIARGIEKPCKHHPDRPARRAKSGRNLGLCHECLVEARKVGAANRMKKKAKLMGTDGGKPARRTRREKPSFVGAAGELHAPPDLPEFPPPKMCLKLYCMKCGFPMAIEDPMKFLEQT